MPVRIQRKRTKGYRLPPNAVYVGRPSKWGNPYRVASAIEHGFANEGNARRVCVEMFAETPDGEMPYPTRAEIKAELRGKDLACWCPLVDADGNPVPCHADVLLEWANS